MSSGIPVRDTAGKAIVSTIGQNTEKGRDPLIQAYASSYETITTELPKKSCSAEYPLSPYLMPEDFNKTEKRSLGPSTEEHSSPTSGYRDGYDMDEIIDGSHPSRSSLSATRNGNGQSHY
jgi:hypothetical protein